MNAAQRLLCYRSLYRLIPALAFLIATFNFSPDLIREKTTTHDVPALLPNRPLISSVLQVPSLLSPYIGFWPLTWHIYPSRKGGRDSTCGFISLGRELR